MRNDVRAFFCVLNLILTYDLYSLDKPSFSLCYKGTGMNDSELAFAHLIMSEHVIESISQLISDLLDLELLSVDLVLDVVDPLVQLGDVHLAVLKSASIIRVFDLIFLRIL